MFHWASWSTGALFAIAIAKLSGDPLAGFFLGVGVTFFLGTVRLGITSAIVEAERKRKKGRVS